MQYTSSESLCMCILPLSLVRCLLFTGTTLRTFDVFLFLLVSHRSAPIWAWEQAFQDCNYIPLWAAPISAICGNLTGIRTLSSRSALSSSMWSIGLCSKSATARDCHLAPYSQKQASKTGAYWYRVACETMSCNCFCFLGVTNIDAPRSTRASNSGNLSHQLSAWEQSEFQLWMSLCAVWRVCKQPGL